MINVQDIRKGMVFKFEDDLFTVMFMQHVTPGKGGAFVKIRARSQKNGNAKEFNFRSGEKIETVDVFEKSVTYSYKEGDSYVFMDNETYEQYHVEAELCEDLENYIVLNGELTVSIMDSKIIAVNLPNSVDLKVVHCEPGVKGDTATRATKTVEVETGYKVTVPLFINEGNVIRIDTRSGEYIERISN
ncbi:MAG: elongation factor P [Spirochaetes bacterium]|nr:elongation factor P [Spirochaetota bacterium]